jgi:hypothetical protein
MGKAGRRLGPDNTEVQSGRATFSVADFNLVVTLEIFCGIPHVQEGPAMLQSLVAWFSVVGVMVGCFWLGVALEGEVYPYLRREMKLRANARR